MVSYVALNPGVRVAAERFIHAASPERLHALLDYESGAWSDAHADLDDLRYLPQGENHQLSSMFLEGIWIKTNDPRRVFEALLQRGAAISLDLRGQYENVFSKMPWLERMWRETPGIKQAELILFALERGEEEEADPEQYRPAFDLWESFCFAKKLHECVPELQQPGACAVWKLIGIAFREGVWVDDDRQSIKDGLKLLGKMLAE